MKSVVVEASTVAKAIEIAWTKAEKPEEFFIRILQEHSSGFLGFGAQKAKIVFFFKNTQKSDSLFPVVVKQKEYASFFGNTSLKTPDKVNVVDHELNKNVILSGGQPKKKQHNNQHPQKKSNHNNAQVDTRANLNQPAAHGKPVVHVQSANSVQGQSVKQVKVQASPVRAQGNELKVAHHADTAHKSMQPKPLMQVSLQEPVAKSMTEHEEVVIGKKEDVVKDIAKVLKKVQTQKVVAPVSRAAHVAHTKNFTKSEKVEQGGGVVNRHKTTPKPAMQKFETYADFINSTTGVPVAKESIVSQVTSAVSKIEAVILPQLEPVKHEQKSVSAAATTARVPLKMKRRPLTTENPGVSGITRFSGGAGQSKAASGVQVDDSNKNEKE